MAEAAAILADKIVVDFARNAKSAARAASDVPFVRGYLRLCLLQVDELNACHFRLFAGRRGHFHPGAGVVAVTPVRGHVSGAVGSSLCHLSPGSSVNVAVLLTPQVHLLVEEQGDRGQGKRLRLRRAHHLARAPDVVTAEVTRPLPVTAGMTRSTRPLSVTSGVDGSTRSLSVTASTAAGVQRGHRDSPEETLHAVLWETLIEAHFLCFRVMNCDDIKCFHLRVVHNVHPASRGGWDVVGGS